MKRGRLIICATPIGNLGDVTMRVLEALRTCDTVCAEDTRVTAKLLASYDIDKHIERLDEAILGARVDGIIERIRKGEVIAYCSDAGLPGVSDPGLRLVEAARSADVDIDILPGATAVQTAYVASGFVNPRYYFGGFFPRKVAEQRTLLTGLRTLDAVLVFYESPNRVVTALETVADMFPLREIAICRELTKLHEQVIRDLVPQVYETFRKQKESGSVKGEITMVIDGPNLQEQEADFACARAEAQARAAELVAQGIHTKEAVKMLMDEFGLPRNEAYDLMVEQAESV